MTRGDICFPFVQPVFTEAMDPTKDTQCSFLYLNFISILEDPRGTITAEATG